MSDLKVLVIGQGGREHALVKALKNSASVREVHCAPGNAGIASETLCHALPSMQSGPVLELCRRLNFDLVVIGPEAPLAAGLADDLRAAGILVFGPSRAAAQLEASKIFAKQFMVRAGIPTSEYLEVSSVDDTLRAADRFTAPYVLKADGLAAGKGVFICQDRSELGVAARQIFEEKTLGAAADRAMLEQFQPGWELSYLILTNGEDYRSLPLAQDHKRLKDQDKGPNTGGMGTVAPLSIALDLDEHIREQVLGPAVQTLKSMGLLYRGVLFVGLMITPSGPSVLEFNVRFGDPEAQSILPLLKGDWGQVMLRLAKGELSDLEWQPLHLACVVLAAGGYPDQPQKGVRIAGEIGYQTAASYFLHAATEQQADGSWVTAGGRVLNAIGVGSSRAEALRNAYSQAQKVAWPGLQMRHDIGAKASTV
ncbi:MAG: phosphoribosylamine--glycine ligase [Bdellovibrionales bacterium]